MKNTHRYFCLILFFFSMFQINGNAEILIAADYSGMAKSELNDAFVRAVETNDSERLERLIQAGADVNTSIRYFWTEGTGEGCCDWDATATAFNYAAMKDYPDIIKILLKFQKDLNVSLDKAFLVAVCDGSLGAAKELIKSGADINYIDENKNTPLILAIQKGRSGLAKELIKSGAAVNHVGQDKNTPLILAIKYGRSDELIRTLLDAGADVSCANKNGRTALMEAVKNHDLNIVQELLKIPAMHAGSFFGFGTKPINYADEDGNTALIHAVKNIRYSYIAGRAQEYRSCIDSQSIVEKLFNTPGIDHHHANEKGETAITLFEKFKKDHRMF